MVRHRRDIFRMTRSKIMNQEVIIKIDQMIDQLQELRGHL